MSEWADADVEAVARVICGADGKVSWTEHIPAIYPDMARALLASGVVVPARVVEEARRAGAEEAIAAAAYEIDAATSIPVAARAAIRAVLLGRVRRGEVLTEGRDRAGEGAGS